MTKNKDFEPITFVNNWEKHEYYVDGKLVQKLPGTIYVKNLIEPGKFEPLKLVAHDATVEYSDMGHTCQATSLHYFIKSELFGNKITIPLVSMISNSKFFVAAGPEIRRTRQIFAILGDSDE